MVATTRPDEGLQVLIEAFYSVQREYLLAAAGGSDDELAAAQRSLLPILDSIKNMPAQTPEGAVEKGRVALLILREFLMDDDGEFAAFVLAALEDCFKPARTGQT